MTWRLRLATFLRIFGSGESRTLALVGGFSPKGESGLGGETFAKNLPGDSYSRATEAMFFVAAFLPISLALSGSYAASKIQVGPVYFFDVVVAVSAMAGIALLIYFRHKVAVPRERQGLTALIVLFSFALIALSGSDFSRDALRDFHSYLLLSYSVIIMLLWPMVSRKVRRWGYNAVYGALLVGWLATSLRIANAVFDWGLSAEIGGSDVFAIRADVEGWLLGCLSALILLRFVDATLAARVTVFPWIIFLQLEVAFLGSRAGHLSATVMLALALVLVVLVKAKNGYSFRGSKYLVRGLVVFSLTLVIGVTLTPIGQKHLGGLTNVFPALVNSSALNELQENDGSVPLLSVGDQSSPFAAGEGTARARLESWKVLSEWVLAEPRTTFFGVGLGTDYFWESGARVALAGEIPREAGENRWPHNYFLTLIAQLGLVGFASALLLYFRTYISQAKSAFSQDKFGQLIFVLLPGLMVVSAFGVVAENPYGSVPLAWMIGIGLGSQQYLSRSSESA